MNPLIERIYATKQVEDAEGNIRDIEPGVKHSEGMALYRLIRARGASETLEVGMAIGLSALFMCQAHKDAGRGRHTAVDPRQGEEYRFAGVHNVRKAGLEQFFRLLHAPSDAALPKLVAEGETFDLIFIDGKHLFDFALVDFYFSDKLLRPGGCVVFHDYWMPAVRKALSFVLHNRQYRVLREAETTPLALLQRMGGFLLNLFQSRNDVFSLKLVSAPGGRNYCALEKMADDARLDGHFKNF
jgi:predicted O-methyltransferase YrrM